MSNFKHGMKGTKEYIAWLGMIARCETHKGEMHIRRYRERGISIDPVWRNSFQAFFDHIGRAPDPSYTVDRIDNNRGYEPGNVRWATRQEQARNRSTNSKITVNGKEVLMLEECERRGIDVKVVRRRLNLGWALERALSEPLRKKLTSFATLALFCSTLLFGADAIRSMM